MIVDFPKIKLRLNRLVNLHLIRVHQEQIGFMKEIKNHAIHEGDGAKYQTVDNQDRNIDLRLLTSRFEVTFDEIRNLRVNDVFALYEKMSASIAEQQVKLFFEQVSDSCEEIGNTVDGSALDPSEAFLEVLRTIHIEFDESRDRPHMPTIFAGTAAVERMRARFEAMSPDELKSHEKEKQAILDRKYEEYVLREGDRKLVN